jgi:hypothetical protein
LCRATSVEDWGRGLNRCLKRDWYDMGGDRQENRQEKY